VTAHAASVCTLAAAAPPPLQHSTPSRVCLFLLHWHAATAAVSPHQQACAVSCVPACVPDSCQPAQPAALLPPASYCLIRIPRGSSLLTFRASPRCT
jgi:hypothetical protein